MRIIARSIRTTCLLTASTAMCLLFLESARAADSKTSQAVARLFGAGEKSTPPAITAARSQYDQLKRLRPKDARVDLAFGLVLVNQHKYRDGLALVCSYLASHQ